MNIIGVILFMSLFIYSINYQKYKLQLFLVVFSILSTDISIRILGSKFPIYQIIGLYWFISYKIKTPKIINLMKYEFLLLVLLALYFNFISPWSDDFSNLRQWNQSQAGRSITALLKISFNILFTIGLYKFLKARRISIYLLQKTVSITIIFCIIIGFIDMFFEYFIRGVILEPVVLSQLKGRFLGFCHEPKAFGRGLVVSFLFVLAVFLHTKIHIKKLFLYIIFVSILLSFSASAFISLFFSLLSTMVFLRKKIIKKIFISSLLFISVLISFNFFFMNNKNYKNVMDKIQNVSQGNEQRKLNNEPIFFTRLEVFDRAALNFFYNQPEFLMFGVGPNLISIPSSIYMDESAKSVLGGLIVGGPAMGSISLISRSGVVGFLLFLFLFINLNSSFKKTKFEKYSLFLLVTFFTFFSLNYHPFVFIVIAHLLSLTNHSPQQNKLSY